MSTNEDSPASKSKWHLPSWEQIVFLIKALSVKEKVIVLGSICLAWLLLSGWGLTIYLTRTDQRPATGGNYIEGIQGQPLYINPILANNNPVDSDLSLLIFSSLFRYTKDGKLEQDITETWSRSEDGMVYLIKLKNSVKWHDGKSLTADDVIFTLNLIRNPAYGSSLRGNWEGTEVKKIDDYNIEFKIKKAFTPFLHNLTFGILPKHLWENVTSDKFILNDLNKNPVGSGLFAFKEMKKNKDGKIMSVTLESNREYYGKKANLKEASFNFYETADEVADAYKREEIDGISYLENETLKNVADLPSLKIYEIPTTRAYGVFFNPRKSALLADKAVRKILNSSVNKEAMLAEVLNNRGTVINTPLLPNMLGFDQNLNHYEYNPDKAKDDLDKAGWKKLSEKELKKMKEAGEGMDNILYNEKEKRFLSFTLSVPDYPELVKTADFLKREWEKIGVRADLDIVDTSETLQNKISNREYEALLFGEVLQADPDPTPFWHSGSKQAPGLNLSLFENDEVDQLLDEARQEVNEEERAKDYHRFQEIVAEEAPALFLFSPSYLYGLKNTYSGVGVKVIYNQSQRLNDLGERYLFTSRTKK